MQRIPTTVTPEGHLVLPPEVRERLDVSPGGEVIFVLEDDQVIVLPGGSVIERTAGMLRPPPGLKVPETAEEMRRVAEEVIAEDALRRMGG